MKTIYTVVILLGLCNPLAAQTYGSHSETVMYTSICKILTNSDHFNGRIVGVFGVLKTGRGLGLLFLTKEHASWNDLANAVDIIPDGRFFILIRALLSGPLLMVALFMSKEALCARFSG